MKICELIQEQIAAGVKNADVEAHLRICSDCAELASDLDRILSCPLPPCHAAPPARIDDAIRAAAAKTAAQHARIARMFRIWVPAAAALAVCFLFYFEPMSKQQPLAMPTHATVTGDWTGAVMDGEIAQVSLEVKNSISNLSLSDSELLLSQLEADFTAYASR